jgi:hypothetical protein
MKIVRKNRLRMKDFFKLPDDVQGFLVMLAEEHGVSLKSYLKRCPSWGLEWSDGEKMYSYKRGWGVYEVGVDRREEKRILFLDQGGKKNGKENEEDFRARFSEEC